MSYCCAFPAPERGSRSTDFNVDDVDAIDMTRRDLLTVQ
jgi:hypothetical protein